MQTFLQFYEGYINFGDYNLEHKFHHYNTLLFESKIPVCPIVWSDYIRVGSKSAAGLTTFTSRGREYIPGTMKIEISTRFKRTEEMLDSTLIHEMIHAYWIVNGHPKEQHGFLFQSMAHQCQQKTGIPIAITDLSTDLELTIENSVETTVLTVQDLRTKQWYAIFYGGTAFDDPKKQNELKAYWGRAGTLPRAFNNEIFVIKVQSSLMTKYKASRSISQTRWFGISDRESQDIFQHGKILFKIVSGSVSAEEAAKQMPSKPTLVVLRTNTRTNESTATFYMPNVNPDVVRSTWRGSYHAGYNVEIFTTNTTVFNRGFKMLRDPNRSIYYNVKPDTVAELRRNAHYLEQWMQ